MVRVGSFHLALAALLVLAGVGCAESWNQYPAPDSSEERFGPAAAILDDGTVIVFGGESNAGETFNDLHEFSQGNWRNIQTINPPPARLGASLTQISDHEVALYGGQGEYRMLLDFWVLDLDTHEWREVEVEEAPPPRKFHVAFFYDGTLYIAGGVGQDGKPRRDLWGYQVESNAWIQGPDAPEEFWGAYATVYCESPCTAYILGPVSLVYDLVKGVWRHLEAGGQPPPPKYLAAFARQGSKIHMFGGLYTHGERVYSTSCHFSYDLAAGSWTYHHGVPSPFEDTGLWGAQAFWYRDRVRIEGGLLSWNCAELLFEALLSGVHPFLASLPPECYGWNKNVYEWCP